MKPNILLIMTDQQRFDTIGALGNPLIRTPVLDRLVERSVAFTRSYTPTPVCVAARCSMLTGKPAHQTGCFDNSPMPKGVPSLMEYLRDAGYQTHGAGKMHFTFRGPEGRRALWGFESRDFIEENSRDDDFKAALRDAGYGHVKDPSGVRGEMYYLPQPSQLPARLHDTAWIAERSLDFLKRRDRARPFFLFTSFIKPHPPFEVPTPWNKLYRAPEMPLPKRPDDAANLLTYWNHVQNRYKYRDQGTDDNLIRAMKAYYYASISFIDYHVGRLIQHLEEAGQLDDTVILFTSDHGELLGDYDSFGKRCFLDAAARVPLLASYPDALQPGICDRPATLLDILPTCLHLAGIESTESFHGASLVDLASGSVDRNMVFGQFQQKENALYMAASRRWKYIYSAPDDREWLFDLQVDPDETRNRAENLMYKQVTAAMRTSVIAHLRADGYTAPLDGEQWRKYPHKGVSRDPDAGLLFQDTPASLPTELKGYTAGALCVDQNGD